jgi:hypothetical protein
VGSENVGALDFLAVLFLSTRLHKLITLLIVQALKSSQ